MRIINLYILYLFFFFSMFTSILHPKEDSQKKLQLEEKRQGDKKSGYGNYEVDSLHRSIQSILPSLKKNIEKDEKGKWRVKIPVAAGETIKGIGERYIYNGVAYLYCDSTAEKLEQVVFYFERVNPLVSTYKGEKRILTNPTPFFSNDPEVIDRNDDITIAYYEDTSLTKPEFKKVSEISLKEIPYYSKKRSIVETYLKYTRKALRQLEKEIYASNLEGRTKIEYMLQLK